MTAYAQVRALAEALAAPLSPEDQTVQSMADVSPTKWHRAHTSWFFETFLLAPFNRQYRAFDPAYAYLFNSYYEAVGPRHPRPERGLLSRPGIADIARYRAHVDAGMEELIATLDPAAWRAAAPLLELGLHHEEQHQELILMDIKHVFWSNPLRPAYAPAAPGAAGTAPPPAFADFEGGLVEIGHDGAGFAFDNEGPRHRIWLEPFRLAARLATCGEYLAFIEDGGYRRPELWLSDGWAAVQAGGWTAPLYWSCEDGACSEHRRAAIEVQRISEDRHVHPLSRDVGIMFARKFCCLLSCLDRVAALIADSRRAPGRSQNDLCRLTPA